MNRIPESNQEVMDTLFPLIKECKINTLVPLVTKYDDEAEPWKAESFSDVIDFMRDDLK